MSISNHGVWHRYAPDPWPDMVPPDVMFARRSTDSVDWYFYNHDVASFEADTVKCILWRPDTATPWKVVQASRDATRLFPQDGTLILEVTDTTGDVEAYLGRIYQSGAIVDKPVDLVAYAKDARWNKETSTLMVGAAEVAMDDRSKSLILGSYIASQHDPDWTTIWQAENGPIPVNAATMAAVFDAMTARINACFTTYADVASGIAGGTITTTEAIDTAFAAIP